ncbi:MAG: PAS domain S-box protein [Gemmatimonadetes bacterium]|nr:PAS domain S-box protein [Gemmatimonadota bacterium]
MAGTDMLNRYSIRHVIVGTMAAVTLIAVSCIVVLLVTAGAMHGTVERQADRLGEDEAIADSITLHVQNQIVAAERYMATGDAAHISVFRVEGLAVYDRIRMYLFLDLEPRERLLVESIREQHQAIEVNAQQMFSLREDANAPVELAGSDELRAQLAEFLTLRRERTHLLLSEQERVWGWLYVACGILIVIFVAIMFAAVIFLRRRLLDPMRSLTKAARRIGAGDFDARVDVVGDDELANVAQSFNRMAERLQHARQTARDAEHRFRDLVEGLSTVVWEGDATTFRCTYVSPQAEQMLGYRVSEWTTGDIWRTLIHPDDYGWVTSACATNTAAGRDHVLEYRAVRNDGEVVWLRDFVRVLMDSMGRPQRLRGVLTDVTAIRAAGDALRASEQRYHSLFDQVPVGLYRTTPDGRMIDANPVLVDLLGYPTREALLRTNAADAYLNAGDRRLWQEMLDSADDAVEVDRRHRRMDGSLIWLRDTARAVRDETGAVEYYEGTLQDISAHITAEEAVRRSEARFRSLIENASDGVLILSAEGLVTYQSPAVERILGYAPESMIGTSPFHLVHPDDLANVRESFGDVMTPGGHGKSVEFRCRHANGSYRMLHVLGSNLLDDPAVGGIVVNMIDSTVHRSLEEQLHHSQRLEAVGRLAGGIAHDFNNLLTAIRGYTDLLGDRLTDDTRAHADVLEIRRAVERAARLTRQLLAFSRRQVVRPAATELGSVIRELQQMLRRLIPEEIPLSTEIADDAWVFADPGQIEQVVVNLVVNARDAAPRTGITIVVDLVDIPDDDPDATGVAPGPNVRLTIADDGTGIDPEILPHIFEPFFTTKDMGQGTGLGLATVYGIVQDAGGQIVVASSPEAGTTMRVYLPRIERPVQKPARVQPRTLESPQGTELVLLVEDEPAVRALAERVLMRQGYHVLSAGNGVEAIELVRSTHGPIDLLVTDVVMPEMGGVELAKQLLEMRPDLRVLFISGYAADAVPTTDGSGRQLYFLEKPFSPARFAEYVRHVLDADQVSVYG